MSVEDLVIDVVLIVRPIINYSREIGLFLSTLMILHNNLMILYNSSVSFCACQCVYLLLIIIIIIILILNIQTA